MPCKKYHDTDFIAEADDKKLKNPALTQFG